VSRLRTFLVPTLCPTSLASLKSMRMEKKYRRWVHADASSCDLTTHTHKHTHTHTRTNTHTRTHTHTQYTHRLFSRPAWHPQPPCKHQVVLAITRCMLLLWTGALVCVTSIKMIYIYIYTYNIYTVKIGQAISRCTPWPWTEALEQGMQGDMFHENNTKSQGKFLQTFLSIGWADQTLQFPSWGKSLHRG